jgi:hypothetical protein
MKRKLLFGATFLLVAWAATYCEALSGCKVCKQVTYIDGIFDHEGNPQDYCDADLIRIEATPDYVNGTTRIKWECN